MKVFYLRMPADTLNRENMCVHAGRFTVQAGRKEEENL